MIHLTSKQEELFDIWIQKYIKESGHDFVFGFYVILEGEDKMVHLASPEHQEWYENKKKQFLEEN